MGKKCVIEPGQVFGSLKVIEEVEPHITPGGTKKRQVLCDCVCGKKQVFWYLEIKRGGTKSCGCKKAEYVSENRQEHGLSKSEVYKTWSGMKNRCYNQNQPKYKQYGARGIKVCDRWLESFENFFEDMGHPPHDHYRYTIERIDVDGDYEPSNCKWASSKEQSRNKTNNAKILIEGVERSVLSIYDEFILNNPFSELDYNTFKKRVYVYGWDLEDALTLTKQNGRKYIKKRS